MERVKCRVFAGLAALALSGGVLVAAGPSAGAATQLCGSTCVTHNPNGQLTIQELTTGVTPSQYWQNLDGVL